MTAAMTAFACSDACMKALGQEMPLFQALFLRGCGTTLFLWGLTVAMGQARLGLPRRDWVLIAARVVAEMGAAWFFITALFQMPLANVSAVLQALPLAVTLAGAVVLRERIGRAQLLAILVGFAGVLLIVRPGAEGFGWPALYALASVACVTVRDLLSRLIAPDTPSLLVAAVTAGGVAAFGGVGSIFVAWTPVDGATALILIGAMSFVMLAYVASVSAMRVGELAVVAPFRYTSLLVSIALGVVAFGTVPDALTLTGAGIVVATGLFTFLRERTRPRAQPAVEGAVDTGGALPYSAPTPAMGEIRPVPGQTNS
jgi:S-adenosylmethionine uptake transporter